MAPSRAARHARILVRSVQPLSPESLADSGKTYVLFCAAGWRSALFAKTLADMGFENVAHVEGGFGALKAAGGRWRARTADGLWKSHATPLVI